MNFVGERSLVDAERQRFLQAEADHAVSIFFLVRQGIEIEHDHAHGGIGHHGDHIAGAVADRGQRFGNGQAKHLAVEHVDVAEIGHHGAGRKAAAGADIEASATAAGSQHAVGSDLTG